MGRLLNPGLGELLDRLSILELKIQRYPGAGDPYKDEAYAIRTRLPGKDTLWGPVLKRLIEVNTALWDLEEQLRGYRRLGAQDARDLETIAQCGLSIQAQNDTRNLIIQAANAAMGDPYKEKGD